MNQNVFDLLESVKVAKAEIERMEKENVNINQFFPSMPHNFEKYSTGETSYWSELMSSVSCAKSKKGKCSAKTSSHDMNLYKNTNALLRNTTSPDEKDENEDENTEEQNEEEITEQSLNDTVQQIVPEDKKEFADAPVEETQPPNVNIM